MIERGYIGEYYTRVIEVDIKVIVIDDKRWILVDGQGNTG
jgi:hypothetical protein